MRYYIIDEGGWTYTPENDKYLDKDGFSRPGILGLYSLNYARIILRFCKKKMSHIDFFIKSYEK